MNTYDIVGLGACGVDLAAEVPAYPAEGIKVIADTLSVYPGGVTADNITQSARLGLTCAWIGTLGNDNHADYLVGEFNKVNVATPNLTKLDKVPTQQFWTWQDKNGSVGMIGHTHASKALNASLVRERFTDIISQATHFHTEVAVIPLSAALEGARIAKKAGVRVFVDLDSDPYYLIEHEKIGTEAELVELLSLTDVLKTTERAVLALTKETNVSQTSLNKIIELGPSIVAVTRAERGCIIADKNTFQIINGVSVKAVDTIGAGDAFMGGLSYALLKGFDLKKAGAFANACGAFKCTRKGTQSGGNLLEIEQFMN